MTIHRYRFINWVSCTIAIVAATGCASAPQPPLSTSPSIAQAPSPAPSSAASEAPFTTPSDAIAPTQDVQAVPVVGNLEHPWGMVWLPDGSMLITERPGRLRVVRQGVLDPNPIAGVPEVLAEGQGGLLDISLHPRFADNRLSHLFLWLCHR
jgi:aldose sugar dehydrogenase